MKLSNLEDFCQNEHIFFSEQDRIAYTIDKSKRLFNKFKTSLHKGFKDFKEFKESWAFEYLMKHEVDLDRVKLANNPFAN